MFMLKERQQFNSFKTMANYLYALNPSLITTRVTMVESVRRLVVHKVT